LRAAVSVRTDVSGRGPGAQRGALAWRRDERDDGAGAHQRFRRGLPIEHAAHWFGKRRGTHDSHAGCHERAAGAGARRRYRLAIRSVPQYAASDYTTPRRYDDCATALLGRAMTGRAMAHGLRNGSWLMGITPQPWHQAAAICAISHSHSSPSPPDRTPTAALRGLNTG